MKDAGRWREREKKVSISLIQRARENFLLLVSAQESSLKFIPRI